MMSGYRSEAILCIKISRRWEPAVERSGHGDSLILNLLVRVRNQPVLLAFITFLFIHFVKKNLKCLELFQTFASPLELSLFSTSFYFEEIVFPLNSLIVPYTLISGSNLALKLYNMINSCDG